MREANKIVVSPGSSSMDGAQGTREVQNKSMDMSGEYRLPAPREAVWKALNDPEMLKASIPGCDELVMKSDTELSAKVTAKVGPVKAKFAGDVRLEDLNPPESYRLVGEGKGGAAGFAKGGANVSLEEVGNETILRYTAHADIGGKLAQLGSRLINGTAKKMADEFFSNFAANVAAQHAPVPVAAAADVESAPASAPKQASVGMGTQGTATNRAVGKEVEGTETPFWQKPIAWVGVAVVLLLLYFIL